MFICWNQFGKLTWPWSVIFVNEEAEWNGTSLSFLFLQRSSVANEHIFFYLCDAGCNCVVSQFTTAMITLQFALCWHAKYVYT